ncbi:hypothetical protein ABPG77_004814 [Micractinium sp. CCAP 211/92]
MGRPQHPAAGDRFSHTRNSVYLSALFALCCVGYDSTHDIIQRSHINKKWFYLFGATCLFAYLYVRPLIRRRLGSVSSGYINYSTIYICWLLMAVFYHLPSLESMGINIKADISMWLACFLGSLCTLGMLHALYGMLVTLRLLDPKLYSPMAGPREVWSIVVMNSFNLAVVCSTYYSFCGNASPGPGLASLVVAPGRNTSQPNLDWKDAVCHKWLHPVSASSHSAFTRWVIYGEAASNETQAGAAAADAGNRLWRSPAAAANASDSTLQIDFPLDGKGLLPIPATDLVSPIFTMWLTLLLMYAANCLADYSAAATLNAAYTADLRKELASRARRLRRHQRRRSADYAHDVRSAASWATASDAGSEGGASSALSMRDAWASLAGAASRSSFDLLLHRTMSSVGQMLHSPTSTMRRAGSMLFRDDFGIGLATSWLQQAGSLPDERLLEPGKVPIPPDAPSPSFLPMFPWYSGTSADLLKTVLDLVISVRVFLGRFDMRTMQAATAQWPLGPNAPPSGGDGFTFEHLASKDELWWDFVADTGDGGDPTYAIARCLAAPQLRVNVPTELVSAGAAGIPDGSAAVSLAAGQRTLPRANLVVHGGDLCYPSPTDETFETRLFGPYQDAFPPPSHVHPGHLVVNKPDLGPEHWAAAGVAVGLAECRCGGAAGSGVAACSKHSAGSGHTDPHCRMCAKEAALRAYDGPSLFAVPGNHDWIDGLECFQRHIQHKGWMGGWLMPQEKSYFAVRLPHGWWLFGLDLALVDDIDMDQFSYFARIAEERMGPDDQAILVQHCPTWLVDWFWGHRVHSGAKNLRQLVRGPLRGRARVHLAGDLHFMMRHSFRQYGPGQSPSLAPSEAPTPAGASPLGGSPLGGSPTASRFSSRSSTPLPGWRTQPSPSQLHQSLVTRLGASAGGGGGGKAAAPRVQGAAAAAVDEAPGGASPTAAGPLGSSPEGSAPSLHRSQSWSLPPLPGGASPPQRRVPRGEAADAALAALSSPGSSAGSGPQPASTPSRPAGDKHALPLLSPVRSQASRGSMAAAARQPASEAGSEAASQEGWASANGRGSPEASLLPCSSPPAGGGLLEPAGASPRQGATSPFTTWWGGMRVRTSSSPDVAGGAGGNPGTAGGPPRRSASEAGLRQGGDAAAAAAGPGPGPGWQLNDPEHLVVCGAGGGFCHPTHVFSEARFRPEYFPAAGPVYLKSAPAAAGPPTAGGGAGGAGGGLHRGFPSGSSLYSLGHREAEQRRPAGGEWRCEQAFPTPEQSLKLGRANLTFRSVNNRFDIVGGLLYYMLVISVLPRCSGLAEVLEAQTLGQAAALFFRAGAAAIATILTESYASLATLLLVFGILFGLCRSGGIGALPGVPPAFRRRPELHGSTLSMRARAGGLATQLAYAGAHCAAHLFCAVWLLLLLELAIELMIKYEGVGRDGYHSLYKWYRSYEVLHFPDPMGMRDQLERYSLGLYPATLKWVMAAFDVPEAIAVGRTAMCTGGLAALTRLQAAGFYLGVLAYYWLLATPTVGFLFGCYLYISVNWFHVHYDEAFSSLQVPHFKGFCRFHITRSGDLEMFGLALERVPHAWREDPRWRAPHGGGNRDQPAHRAKFPSRWVPVEERPHMLRPPRMVPPPEAQLKVVDYLLVPRYRRP